MKHPGFLKTIEETKDWLDSVGVSGYTIDEETLVVDVNTNTYLINKFENYIPVKFGKINGFFVITGNKLKSLVGCPDEVTGMFSASKNYLKNLVGGPKKVGKQYVVKFNKLTSLEGSPEEINGDFDASSNKDLKSYVGGPTKVDNTLNLSTTKISNFEGMPEKVGTLMINDCKFITLDGMPECNQLQASNNFIVDVSAIPEGMRNVRLSGNFIVAVNPKADSSILSAVEDIQDLDATAKELLAKFEDTEYKERLEAILDVIKKANPDFYETLIAYDIDSHLTRAQNMQAHKDIFEF